MNHLSAIPSWVKVLATVILGVAVCALSLLALDWWLSTPYHRGPWIAYDATLPNGGIVTYQWRDLLHRKIMFGPSDTHRKAQLVWTTPQGQRYRFDHYRMRASEPDIELRLREDEQAVWLVAYGENGPSNREPYVCSGLDLAKGQFARFMVPDPYFDLREGEKIGEVVEVSEPLEEDLLSHPAYLAGYNWADVDSGKAVGRWLYMDRRMFDKGMSKCDIMLHWAPHFSSTRLRKKRVDNKTCVLVVESAHPVYRTAEVRGYFDKYLIVGYSPSGRPKVRATFDFQRNEFTDENLIVWAFGKESEDGIRKSDVAASSYPQWAAQWQGQDLRLLAREHKQSGAQDR